MSEVDMKEGTGAQEETFTQEDIDKNKTIAGLAYIIFFLPLIACPDSRYGRFHANQALILFIVGLAGSIILSIIPIIGTIKEERSLTLLKNIKKIIVPTKENRMAPVIL